MSKANLRKTAGLPPNIMIKLRRDEQVAMIVLDKIRGTFNAEYSEIMQYISDKEG